MFGLFSPKVSSGPLRSHLKKIWPPVQWTLASLNVKPEFCFNLNFNVFLYEQKPVRREHSETWSTWSSITKNLNSLRTGEWLLSTGCMEDLYCLNKTNVSCFLQMLYGSLKKLWFVNTLTNFSKSDIDFLFLSGRSSGRSSNSRTNFPFWFWVAAVPPTRLAAVP